MRARSFSEAFLDLIDIKYKEYCKTVPDKEETRFFGMVFTERYYAVYHVLGFFETKCDRFLTILWEPSFIQKLIAGFCKKLGIVSFVT